MNICAIVPLLETEDDSAEAPLWSDVQTAVCINEFHAQGVRAACSVPAVRYNANMDLTQRPHWLMRAVFSLRSLTRLSLFLQVPMPGMCRRAVKCWWP